MNKCGALLWLEQYPPERLDGRSLAILREGLVAERALLDEIAIKEQPKTKAAIEADDGNYAELVDMLMRVERVLACQQRCSKNVITTAR